MLDKTPHHRHGIRLSTHDYSAGEKIGEIIVQHDGRIIARAPLVAKEHVGKVQFLARIARNLQVIFSGK